MIILGISEALATSLPDGHSAKKSCEHKCPHDLDIVSSLVGPNV